MPPPPVEGGTLETLVGPLLQTLQLLVKHTILHSDQLMTERRVNFGLRDQWFYPADSAVYTVEEVDGIGETFLYLGRGETNPIFNNIEEATQQLIMKGHYVPPLEDVEAVKSAKSTSRVKLSDLILQGDDPEWRYFEIDTANYDTLNHEQRKVAEHVYGQGDDFVENMKMLNEAGITKTRVRVLALDYVKQNAQDGAIARLSVLYRFVDSSMFDASTWTWFSMLGCAGYVKSPKATR